MDEKKKRKVRFNSDIDLNETKKKQKNISLTTNSNEYSRLHCGNHTLDSDDDDQHEQQDQDEQYQTNEKDFQKMSENDLHAIGQEKATIGFDDDVKITPFNIDEELEDGQYDQSGCFQWKKKDKDEIRDAWLDEIDWTNVKNYKLKTSQTTFEETNEENEKDQKQNQLESFQIIQSMLNIMKQGETVMKTIKRLGTSTTNTNKTNSKKKNRRLLPGEMMETNEIEENEEELKEKKKNLELMIGFADQFVTNGDLDIYQQTFENLKTKFDQRNNSSNSHLQSSTTFDMFHHQTDIQQSITNQITNDYQQSSKNNLMWEYKIDLNNDIKGPFSTEEMIRLIQQGKFDKDKTFCRRIQTEQFYSIKRIDFDLYLD